MSPSSFHRLGLGRRARKDAPTQKSAPFRFAVGSLRFLWILDFGFWIFRPATVAALMLAAVSTRAADNASDAEMQGRALTQQLLAQQPTENYTNTGHLRLRDATDHRTDVPLRCEILVTATNWATAYEANLGTGQIASLYIIHTAGRANEYYYRTNAVAGGIPILGHLFRSSRLSGADTMAAFAGSDFWIADLGQEFLHWPQQMVLRQEVKRGQGCTVLESTTPHPTVGGYSRVVSWVDTENNGLVQAFAYDSDGQKLKEFYPKEVKKVNGQWHVGMMEMDNDQTDSRTRLEFDLEPAGADAQK